MIISGAHIIGINRIADIDVDDGIINAVEGHMTSGGNRINFVNAVAFPGLINSHDHLDFNLFPQLGNRIYSNYTEWAHDIHCTHKHIMNEVLKVPITDRINWGIYKNLLNGFTTVVNHGKDLPPVNELINVFQDCHSLHSVRFEKNWKVKLNRSSNKSFVIHVGEGTDESSCREIDQLIRWNVFKKPLIAVHAVAMTEKQARHFKGLVWCPDSNYFLLNKTAAIDQLKSNTPVIFGTDSTLSSRWNLWEHIRLARKTQLLTDEELFESLTSNPATTWKLNTGIIEEKKIADIVIAKCKNGLANMDSFYSLNPEDILMVMQKGHIRLFDESIKDQVLNSSVEQTNYIRIELNQSIKYVQGDISSLIERTGSFSNAIKMPLHL